MNTSLFGEVSNEQFLKEYWQKKPLLVRQAFQHFESPISPDELAGLAMEEESNSRLIIEKGQDWQVKHGPLAEEDFSSLPEKKWTLLVQHADALDPEVNALLQRFRFLPNWRLDDIMISYASDGGGVGAHFDYYDVFLLQAGGTRRWRTGQHCDANSPLVPNQPNQLLQDFECENDWLVEAGDLLYIPAQVAHWGEAVNESMTWSIGFRAPSDNELLLDLSQHLASELVEDQRYQDGPELISQNSGEIADLSIQRIQQRLSKLLQEPDKIAHWLGQYATHLKPGLDPSALPLDFADDLKSGPLKLSSFNRVSYINSNEQVYTYINGQAYPTSLQLAKTLSHYESFTADNFEASDQASLQDMLEAGLLLRSE
ncbi:cupin domain-containing protein [Agaribacterium sp. ZY112]|uniref:cupin domain-containing protein n=1 Tax=Agaribacterium sp. ZY112 TaxID=3233574 RepID=UPI003526104D